MASATSCIVPFRRTLLKYGADMGAKTMLKILFRGKDTNTKEWRYGYLVKSGFERNALTYIMTGDRDKPTMVDRDTVGQYTGLHDKRLMPIFEGDIVTGYQASNFEIKGGQKAALVMLTDGGFSPFAEPGWECVPEAETCLVVGNIYDNADILGEDGLRAAQEWRNELKGL